MIWACVSFTFVMFLVDEQMSKSLEKKGTVFLGQPIVTAVKEQVNVLNHTTFIKYCK